jgi:hypothetical protein
MPPQILHMAHLRRRPANFYRKAPGSDHRKGVRGKEEWPGGDRPHDLAHEGALRALT